MNICVFAFATSAVFFREVITLSRRLGDSIDWSVVIPHGPYRRHFDDLLLADRILYIYGDFNAEFTRDDGPPELNSPDFSINMVLATDKDGYRHETKEFQYKWAAAMLRVYRRFLARVRPEFVIFPTVETAEGSLLINLCRELGIGVMNAVHLRTLGDSFFSSGQLDAFPSYYGSSDESSRARAARLIDGFDPALPNPVQYPALTKTGDKVAYRPPHLAVRIFRSIRDRVGPERHYRTEDGLAMRIKRNAIKPLYAFRRWRFKLLQERLFDLTPSQGELPKKFILYAAQVTPEASINAIAPYFVEQERTVDLLRLNMPPGYRLVVKEHPSMAGIRSSSDYRRLRRSPGVVMASASIPTERLASRAALVATVTGTIALECYLAGRPCLMFGRTFFSHLAFMGTDDDLQRRLASLIAGYRPPTRTEKIEEIAKLYYVSYPFVLFEPLNCPYTMERENIANFLQAVKSHIQRLVSAAPRAATAGHVRSV